MCIRRIRPLLRSNDLPTHYPYTRVLTVPNAATVDGLLPEVTARCRVVDT